MYTIDYNNSNDSPPQPLGVGEGEAAVPEALLRLRTANFQIKNLQIWSLGQTNSYTQEVGFLSAPTNFLAQ